MGQKRVFSKVILDHSGCSNKCFLAHFEPQVTRFDPRKFPKCLESKHTAISFLPLPIALGSTLLWPSCERQIPQDEALYKSHLLRAEAVH